MFYKIFAQLLFQLELPNMTNDRLKKNFLRNAERQ